MKRREAVPLADAVKTKILGDKILADKAVQMSLLAEAGMPAKSVAAAALDGIPGFAGHAMPEGPLSDGLAGTGLFPAYFTDMLAVGEATGKTPACLSALHTYYLRQHRMKALLRQAAVQPSAMLLVTLLVLYVILTKVFPVFRSAYDAVGMPVSGAMSAMLLLGGWLDANGGMCALCAALAASLAFFAARSERGSAAARRAWSRTGAGKAAFGARLVQALSMGLDSGMDEATAVEMACDVSGAGADGLGPDAAELGTDEALLEHGLITRAQYGILRAGRDSGKLADAMAYVAGELADGAEAAVRRLSGAVEPCITLFGAALAGGTILAAMLPLLDAMASIG